MEPTESKAEMDEAQKLWQEYLQRCCEYGQLTYTLEQLDGQKRELEKNAEVALRGAKAAAAKHKDIQKALAAKVQMPKPEVETKEAH